MGKKTSIQRLLLLLLLVAALCFGACSAGTAAPGAGPFDASGLTGNEKFGMSAPLEVHFIDVGQADAILVACEGHAMLIDGGNAADSNLMYAYLQRHNLDQLDCVVCSHPHEDHVGGLAGALNYAQTAAAYCSETQYNSKAFENFLEYLDQQGVPLAVPSPGDSFSLGSAQAEFLGPLREGNSTNNNSLILRITYGEISFLFPGDAEREEELDLSEAEVPLKSTVLKVGHHGSATSSSYPFLYYVDPAYAVISVGKNNSYGHPDEGTLSRLRDLGAQVYRTDESGDIICRSDGKTLRFILGGDRPSEAPADVVSAGPPAAATEPPEIRPATRNYVLNTNTKIFHIPDCSAAKRMSEKNKLAFDGTREEIISMGYAPCTICDP